MTLFRNRYRIESIRLKNFDYSQPGAYFITIVTHHRQCLFGTIANGTMQLNESGKIAHQCWMEIPKHFPHTTLDEYIVMPNHIHGIIVLNDIADEKFDNMDKIVPQNSFQHIIPHSIGSIIRGFKIGVTKWFRQYTDIYTVWQRNYYEHIIRNDDELRRIRHYIVNNPLHWELDNQDPLSANM